MGLLEKPSGVGSFSQALISLWFRVPSESMAACAAAFDPNDNEETVLLNGVIPLVVMGQRGKNTDPTQTSEPSTVVTGTICGPNYAGVIDTLTVECDGPCCGIPCASSTVTHVHQQLFVSACDDIKEGVPPVTTPTGEKGSPRNPTFIGVDCSPGGRTLRVNFESNKIPDMVGQQFQQTGYESDSSSGPLPGDPGLDYSGGSYSVSGCSLPLGPCLPQPNDPNNTTVGAINNFNTNTGGGGYSPSPKIGTGSALSGGSTPVIEDISNIQHNETGSLDCNSKLITVTPDHWHHLLVSVNFKSITADDSGITSAAQVYIALDDVNYIENDISQNFTGEGGPNDVVPEDAFDPEGTPGASYTLASPSIPSGSLGIPATAAMPKVYKVEMAEFQMWTGRTEDTGDVGIRRLFIDDKGKPVPIKTARQALGDPVICLHTSGKWIKGVNSEDGAPPNLPPVPVFDPTPSITAYKPDPSLHGPQSPGDKA